MTGWRLALALPGLAALACAATLLRDVPADAWDSVLTWLVAGILLHDGLLATIVIGLGVLATRWLPAPWRSPAVVGLVCWGSLTLVAIPVLSGNGVDPTNETLQDRPYVMSWWIGSAVVLAAVVAAGWWRRLRPPSRDGRTR
ncbi:MAG: hypothetical protein ACRDPQ_17415 [Nocardioidaceae bacterium]